MKMTVAILKKIMRKRNGARLKSMLERREIDTFNRFEWVAPTHENMIDIVQFLSYCVVACFCIGRGQHRGATKTNGTGKPVAQQENCPATVLDGVR